MCENVHTIEFRRRLCVVTELPKQRRVELLQVARGSRFTVFLVPYHKGLREVADLHFADGAVAREVSFGYFTFVPDGGDEEPPDLF